MSSSTTKVILVVAAAAAGLYLLVRSKTPQASAPQLVSPRTGSDATLSWLSNTVSQLIGATAYDPTAALFDRNTPSVNPSVISNPVSPSPSVLPYSYKQATVDIPSILGTDDLFTPADDGGSSGSYIEDDIGETPGYGYA
jgi:hypothetical protein